MPGIPFPGNTTALQLRELTGHAEIPGGTLTIGGTTSSVSYDFAIAARALTSATVPSGTATLILPAVLSGTGAACLEGIGEFCLGTPTQAPMYVAPRTCSRRRAVFCAVYTYSGTVSLAVGIGWT